MREGDVFRTRLVRCASCGGFMLDVVPLGYHAVRWVEGRLLNCVGREVQP